MEVAGFVDPIFSVDHEKCDQYLAAFDRFEVLLALGAPPRGEELSMQLLRFVDLADVFTLARAHVMGLDSKTGFIFAELVILTSRSETISPELNSIQ